MVALRGRVGEQQDDCRKAEQHTESGEDERRPVGQLGVLTACKGSVYGLFANVAITDKRDAHDAEGDTDYLIRPIGPPSKLRNNPPRSETDGKRREACPPPRKVGALVREPRTPSRIQ